MLHDVSGSYQSLSEGRGRSEEGREGGLIEFEVGEAVEVEDEGFKVESGVKWKGNFGGLL